MLWLRDGTEDGRMYVGGWLLTRQDRRARGALSLAVEAFRSPYPGGRRRSGGIPTFRFMFGRRRRYSAGTGDASRRSCLRRKMRPKSS